MHNKLEKLFLLNFGLGFVEIDKYQRFDEKFEQTEIISLNRPLCHLSSIYCPKKTIHYTVTKVIWTSLKVPNLKNRWIFLFISTDSLIILCEKWWLKISNSAYIIYIWLYFWLKFRFGFFLSLKWHGIFSEFSKSIL